LFQLLRVFFSSSSQKSQRKLCVCLEEVGMTQMDLINGYYENEKCGGAMMRISAMRQAH
jgi:hypothetical protein